MFKGHYSPLSRPRQESVACKHATGGRRGRKLIGLPRLLAVDCLRNENSIPGFFTARGEEPGPLRPEEGKRPVSFTEGRHEECAPERGRFRAYPDRGGHCPVRRVDGRDDLWPHRHPRPHHPPGGSRGGHRDEPGMAASPPPAGPQGERPPGTLRYGNRPLSQNGPVP
jgi:hypothetical protein